MKIKVTLGHIAKSTELRQNGKGRSFSCPLAVALNDATNKVFSVGYTGALCENAHISLPLDAQLFVRQADRYANAVNPAEFDLPIEALLGEKI